MYNESGARKQLLPNKQCSTKPKLNSASPTKSCVVETKSARGAHSVYLAPCSGPPRTIRITIAGTI